MLEIYRPELFEVVNYLAKTMHAESAFKDSGWSDTKVKLLLEHPRVFCALVKDDDGYFGGIIGMVGEQFFGPDLVASDLGLFILPEKRGGRSALVLVKAFEDWARSQGVKEIHLGQTTGVEIDRTRRLYESMGYTVVGFSTKKVVKNV